MGEITERGQARMAFDEGLQRLVEAQTLSPEAMRNMAQLREDHAAALDTIAALRSAGEVKARELREARDELTVLQLREEKVRAQEADLNKREAKLAIAEAVVAQKSIDADRMAAFVVDVVRAPTVRRIVDRQVPWTHPSDPEHGRHYESGTTLARDTVTV